MFWPRRSRARLHKWAAEVATGGSFSAPAAEEGAAANLGGLPVPTLTIGTKADISGQQQLTFASPSSVAACIDTRRFDTCIRHRNDNSGYLRICTPCHCKLL